MKCTATAAVAIMALAACGPSGQQSGTRDEGRLHLVVSETPIVLQAGQSLILQLLVIGSGSEQATISSPDLPPFAALDGSVLTLSPGRQYEGDYALTLVAQAGSSTATGTVHVTVVRGHNAPTLESMWLAGTGGDPGGTMCLSMGTCVIDGVPFVTFGVGDADGDSVTVEVEVVQNGQAFSGSPTQSVTSPVGIDRSSHCSSAYDAFHTCIEVQMPGLVPGQSYAFAVRIRDALGATTIWGGAYPSQPDGWVTYPRWRFVQGTP